MKKFLIMILVLTMIFTLVGCTNSESEQVVEPSETPVPTETPTPQKPQEPESIIIEGIIESVDEMILVKDVVGLGAEESVAVKIIEQTVWGTPQDFLAVGKYIEVELSPIMTKSIPPQSNAIKISLINEVISGEILSIDEKSMTIKPTDYNNFDEVVILFADNTKWGIEQSSLKVGGQIGVVLDNISTLSIPPQIKAIKVFGVE